MNYGNCTKLSFSTLASFFFTLLSTVAAIPLSAEEKDVNETSSENKQESNNVIRVTAQRREESIQSVPIAINAFSQRDLRELGAENISDLGRFTPGLETNNNTATQPKYTIRGISTNDFGLGTDPAVGIYVDGVYVGRSGAAQLNFNDIERVEIIKGPQGALFGRNAAAGAIHVITKMPTSDNEGNFQITLGDFSKQKIEGSVNFPVNDNVFFRGSFLSNRRDGFIKSNVGRDLDNEDNFGVRGTFLWDITERTNVIWRTDFDKLDQDAPQVTSLNPSIAPADPFGRYESDIESNETRDASGTSLTITSELNDSLFTSITAYRQFESTNFEEEDGSANQRFFFATENYEDQNQFSQEFRLQSNIDSQLNWVFGLSLFDENAEQISDVLIRTDSLDTFFLIDSGAVPAEAVIGVPPGTGIAGFLLQNFATELSQLSMLSGTPIQQLASQIAVTNLGRPWLETTRNTLGSQSLSFYGDFTYSFTEQLDLNFGLRYTYDKKNFTIYSQYQNAITIPIPDVDPIPFGLVFFEQFSPAVVQENSWNDLTPRIVLEYKANDELLLYVGANQGFKAGGFNTLGFDPAFDPEQVVNYEVGFKSSWLENSLKFNATLFFYQYDDLQILRLSGPSGQIPTYNVRNADAEGSGLEIEFSWFATDNLFLAASYGHLETEYTQYNLFPGETAANDLTGQPLSSMPENMFNLSASYGLSIGEHGELSFRADYNFVDDRVDGSGVGQLTIDSYELLNVRLGWLSPEANWDVNIFVNNALDEEYLIGLGGRGSAIGSPTSSRGQSRFSGVEVAYSFW